MTDVTRPQSRVAARKYVRTVAHDLDLDVDTATRVADYVASEIERVVGGPHIWGAASERT